MTNTDLIERLRETGLHSPAIAADRIEALLAALTEANAKLEALQLENERLTAFIAGVSRISTTCPPKAHNESYLAKTLREVRNGARLILNTTPKGLSDG